MRFDSHIERLLTASSRLVNRLTPGLDGGRPIVVPTGTALSAAVGEALTFDGRTPSVPSAGAQVVVGIVPDVRRVFEAASDGDITRAAQLTNDLLGRTGARPQLNPDPDGTWHLHFHGASNHFGPGWAAGLAAGLTMALGVDEIGRLGVCSADRCDRVYVDSSRNGTRQFCSTRCQNRMKAAAHRARQK
ncbi:CGNR zinc finger domain-containing protein [Flexivirga alba]|uniref:CGNR zinc finger domain-containing protein n=1 Tax=Flexivirga alba TaxID=702742 RepID=A0ABW2AKA5_9MICO